MSFNMSNYDNITEAKREVAKAKINLFLMPFINDWIPGRIREDDAFGDDLGDLIEDLLSVAGSDFEYEAFAAAKQAEITLASVQAKYSEMADELLPLASNSPNVRAELKIELARKYGRD